MQEVGMPGLFFSRRWSDNYVMKQISDNERCVVADAVCTNCCCMCDDIRLEVCGNEITNAGGACTQGTNWFKSAGQSANVRECRVNGTHTTLDVALDAAAALLRDARYPLVYGLTHVSSEAQRAAAGLADRLHGIIDTATSTSHGPSIIGFQQAGKVTCSLGETRNRADLIIFWGTDVVREHPRFFSDYSAEAKGMFVPRGRTDREIVVIGNEPSSTSDRADFFYRINPNSDYEVLNTLRALANGVPLDAERVEQQTGIPLTKWQELMQRMTACRFGSIAFGIGLMQSRGQHANTESLFSLVAEMNAHTRWVCRSIRQSGNVTGADKVLTWRTGYPFAVNLARGFPRYNPGEYSASEALARREVDAALVLAADPMGNLPAAAATHLQQIPYIYVGPHKNETSEHAAIHIPTATYGIHSPGTVYRTDDTPFRLRTSLASNLPKEVDILKSLANLVCD
jgi:formylmethanofuran dehydrogenase subunit B